MFKILVFLLALSPGLALAQVYKCIGSDGRITFAQVPCPDGDGSATAHHVAPANSMQAVVPITRESGTARPVEASAQTVEPAEDSEYRKKIQFQIKSLMAKAAKPDEQDAKAYETAANLLQYAPLNRDGLIAAQDAVSARLPRLFFDYSVVISASSQPDHLHSAVGCERQIMHKL